MLQIYQEFVLIISLSIYITLNFSNHVHINLEKKIHPKKYGFKIQNIH